MSSGIVSFVNLGPGDPALQTRRAYERVAAADVIVDEDGVRVETLLDLATQGKRVVRVVSGDAAGSSTQVAESLALVQAGVSIEVVPGVGVASAALAFGGVVGRAMYVHAATVADVVYAEPPDAPITLIVAPTLPTQRVLVTTARHAAEAAAAVGDARLLLAFGAPEGSLRWFERRPLFGKRVLVTRARQQASGTAALLREQGAEAVLVPTIEIGPPADLARFTAALGELRAGQYGWVVFTSVNGVERTWAALVASGGDARAFGAARLAVIGPATAGALEARGLRADVMAKEFQGESLAEELRAAIRLGPPAPRVLLARAARARDVVPESLAAAGCKVDVVAAYETRPPAPEAVERLRNELEEGRIDAVTLTSSSTVENLCDRLGGRAAALLSRTRVASIGPVTTSTALARGLRVDVTASVYTVPGLIQSLAESFVRGVP
ncbi:MAG: uroporphyrinogen-III synthase [Polyangiaceae bacterium]|jgi:uroporphyrinogen III methyltransferase/synthase